METLRAVAGDGAVALVSEEPDETIRAIVSGWPHEFAPERALALGFEAEPDFEAIVRAYIEDEGISPS